MKAMLVVFKNGATNREPNRPEGEPNWERRKLLRHIQAPAVAYQETKRLLGEIYHSLEFAHRLHTVLVDAVPVDEKTSKLYAAVQQIAD
jgi:hypothetical protein